MKLATVRRHALSLHAVTEEPHHDHASFRVRGRIFVTVPPSADAIHVFVEEADRELAVAMYPDWAESLMWGGKAKGVRIALATAPAAAVKSLVAKAYESRAGKR